MVLFRTGRTSGRGVVVRKLARPGLRYPGIQQKLFTQWGADPIWDNGELTISPVPVLGNFPDAAAAASGLTLAESPLLFDVAGHPVAYDSGRGLWYCDIEFSEIYSYSPFVRLALARYQSHSIQGSSFPL